MTVREPPPTLEVDAEAALSDMEESRLSEAAPFRFISEEEIAEGATVMDIRVGDVGDVPTGLQAAVDAVCGKDGQQGKVR